MKNIRDCRDYVSCITIERLVEKKLGIKLCECKDVTGLVPDGTFKEIIYHNESAAVVDGDTVMQLINITYRKARLFDYEKGILNDTVYWSPTDKIETWFKVIGKWLATIQIKYLEGEHKLTETNIVPFADACKTAYIGYMLSMKHKE